MEWRSWRSCRATVWRPEVIDKGALATPRRTVRCGVPCSERTAHRLDLTYGWLPRQETPFATGSVRGAQGHRACPGVFQRCQSPGVESFAQINPQVEDPHGQQNLLIGARNQNRENLSSKRRCRQMHSPNQCTQHYKWNIGVQQNARRI